MEFLMPQKRIAARGQPAKLTKAPSLKKTPASVGAKMNAKAKDPAKKAKVSSINSNSNGKAALKGQAKKVSEKSNSVAFAKDVRPQAQIEKAKVALKTAKPTAPKIQPEVALPATADVKAAKAPKESKRGRKISIDINPNEAASALVGKWSILFKKAEQIDAKPYNMRAVFEEKTAITHKVLGWGYILANRNDRLEVLFKDGIKYLISNYKP
jgi:hypothetical protein